MSHIEGLDEWLDQMEATEPKRPSRSGAEARTGTKRALYRWFDWLVGHIPEPIRTKANDLKNMAMFLYKRTPKATKSSLKGFAEDHVVEGWEGVDARAFLNSVKDGVLDVWRGKSLKTKLVLDCVMVREEDVDDGHFHSLMETVLSG